MAGADWPERAQRTLALQRTEAALAAQAGGEGARGEGARGDAVVELRFRRACLLHALGRTEEAKAAYLDVLVAHGDHAGALNNLGTLLHATGFRTAAASAYARAAARHPDDPMGHVNLANLRLEDGRLAEARALYETALRLAPAHPEAHQGLAAALAEAGDPESAAAHEAMAFQGRPVTVLPYRGSEPPVGVLLLVSAAGGNVPTRPLLDDRTFQVTAVAAEPWARSAPTGPLPPHQVVFNAVGDADRCAPALRAGAVLAAASPAPVVNRPEAVLATGRAENALRLGALPGVTTAGAAAVAREELANCDAAAAGAWLEARGLTYPLLVRAPGFHTGRHMAHVEGPADLAAALAALPGREVTVMRFLRAASADGKVRKYRVMIVDGRLHPLHLAISSHWNVHYVSSEMSDDAGYRAEEAAFLADMAGTLGGSAVAALELVRETLGLDYGGIDFGLGGGGEVLLFEANATMVVQPPDGGERWDYRRAAVAAVQEAVRGMVLRRAGRG